jgi:7-keto-8-aminopelargonate synthetase-like enzyme
MQALISEADLEAWVAGAPPPANTNGLALWRSPGQQQQRSEHAGVVQHWGEQQSPGTRGVAAGRSALRTLKLFSLNDYLGLASHPEVCEAAASAARQVIIPGMLTPAGTMTTCVRCSMRAPYGVLLNDCSQSRICCVRRCGLQYGMGCRSSAIVGGTSALHRELEEALAALKGTQDCLLTPTGALGSA